LELLNNIKRKQAYGKIKKIFKGDEGKLKQLTALTTSCYAPKNGKACGVCHKCLKIEQEKNL
jgi:7-cyano-7-deazaguanine synthase in queuosine biosynthesis